MAPVLAQALDPVACCLALFLFFVVAPSSGSWVVAHLPINRDSFVIARSLLGHLDA